MEMIAVRKLPEPFLSGFHVAVCGDHLMRGL
jgi:hypothetical protein